MDNIQKENLENPSKLITEIAVKRNIGNIKFAKKVSERLQIYIIKKDAKLIKYIKNPSPKAIELIMKGGNQE